MNKGLRKPLIAGNWKMFKSAAEAAVLIFPTLYAMSGGLLLQWALGYNFSVAVWVGYIACFGMATETAVIMLVYLREALDSIIAQTYSNWEAIVVNDGSKDHTEEVMNEYAAKDSRIRLFTKQNGGITSALNAGLENARGEYFCWLSSDLSE